MTNQSSADGFVEDIHKELLAIDQAEKDKGVLCGSALDHAIKCGHLLMAAQESVKAEKLKWQPWLNGHFGQRVPLSTAGLYMKLARNDEFLFGKMQQIGHERMSLRQAAALVPLTPEGEKKRAKAQAKAEEKKAQKEAEAIKQLKASIPPDEVIADLAVDEIFEMLTEKFDNDQLIDLKDRLVSYLSEKAEEPAKAEEPTPEPAPPPASLEELRQRQSR